MPKKNDCLCGIVRSLGTQGEGVLRTDDTTFFVPGALPGEEISFQVLKVKDGIGYGKLLWVSAPSSDRVSPRCPVFGRCGGCQLQHMRYGAQLAFKREVVQTALRKIGNIEFSVPLPIASPKEYAYRNKMQVPVGESADGMPLLGFYAERSHRIVPTDSCAVHPSWASDILRIFAEYMAANGVRGYDERTRAGTVRHVVVRDMGGRFIIAVVSAQRKLNNAEDLIRRLRECFSEFTLVLNINARDTNVIFGEEFITLYGDGFFAAEEGGIVFRAGPQTFIQVNGDVRTKLYALALEWAAVTGKETIFDCYSGAGLLTAMAAARAKHAYGIEVSAEAVSCADCLMRDNGIVNMQNICGKVEDVLPGLLEREKGEKVSLICDPPRAGMHRSVLRAIEGSGIGRVVLISCNPATLARDLGILTGTLKEDERGQLLKGDGDGAYSVEAMQPFDMFPQSKHVETVVLLQRNG